MWVLSRVSLNGLTWTMDGAYPAALNRSALPVTKSDPVSSSVPTISW